MKLRMTVINTAILLVIACCTFQAQTQARVTSIVAVRNQQQATVRLHVICDSGTYYGLQASQLNMSDNGAPVQNFSILNAASPQTRKPFTAMLVVDVSGSMSGAGMAGLKAAARALVQFMDSTTDSLGIIKFNTKATLVKDCTPDKAALYQAIDSLNAAGATAIWDAAYLGQMVMYSHGNAAQAMIVMSDGGDNSSTVSPAFVIQKAQMFNLRIFTIGLGQAGMGAHMEAMALLTGGQYFEAPTPTQLTSIFLQIASFTRRDFDEYTVRYETPDSKAVQHEVIMNVMLCDTIVTAGATRQSLPAITAIDDPAVPAGSLLTVSPVSPNPAAGGILNCSYKITQEPSAAQPVRIRLYDALGRCVARHDDLRASAGPNQFSMNVQGLPSGLYHLRISFKGETRMTRALIAR